MGKRGPKKGEGGRPKKYVRGKNCAKTGPLPGNGGRPKVFDDEITLGQVQAYAALGLTIKNICDLLGVDESTFHRNMQKHTKLSQVFTKGRAIGVSEAALALKDRIDAKDFNAIKLFLMHIGKWSETQRLELTGEGGAPVKVEAKGITADLADQIRRLILGVGE
jgi:hypothetical protein